MESKQKYFQERWKAKYFQERWQAREMESKGLVCKVSGVICKLSYLIIGNTMNTC